jgi:hypothetical protein
VVITKHNGEAGKPVRAELTGTIGKGHITADQHPGGAHVPNVGHGTPVVPWSIVNNEGSIKKQLSRAALSALVESDHNRIKNRLIKYLFYLSSMFSGSQKLWPRVNSVVPTSSGE